MQNVRGLAIVFGAIRANISSDTEDPHTSITSLGSSSSSSSLNSFVDDDIGESGG
jgi:hypothetical protein